MESGVRRLCLSGDAQALIAIARCARCLREGDGGAQRALRLLARMGDRDAAAFCDAVSGVQETRWDAA